MTGALANAAEAGAAIQQAGLVERLTGGLDLATLLVIVFGLVAGTAWRAGDNAKRGETTAEIRADLIASALSLAANFIIVVATVVGTGAGPLAAAPIAVLAGSQGTAAMSKFREWFEPKK